MPVRIALFADLMKHYAWEESTIEELGGIDGALVRFLSNAFDSKTSPMSRRSVGPACMEILRALLPHDDLDLKSASCSSHVLSKAMNSTVDSIDFEQAISCLEKDLHLVTLLSADGSDKHYCLVHDYLVSPIRTWLANHDNLNWRGRLRQDLNNQARRYSRDPRKTNLLSPLNWLLGKLFLNRNQMSNDLRLLLTASNKKAAMWGAIYTLGLVFFVGMSTELRYKYIKLAEQRQAQVNDGIFAFLNARQDLAEPWAKISLDKSVARKSVQALVSIDIPSQKVRQTLLKVLLDLDVSMAEINDAVSVCDGEELRFWKKHFSKRETLDRAHLFFESKKGEIPHVKWQLLFALCRDYRLIEMLQSQKDPASEMIKFIACVDDQGKEESTNELIATCLAKDLVQHYEASNKRDPFLMPLSMQLFGLSEGNVEIPKSISEFASASASSPIGRIALPSQWILSRLSGKRSIHPVSSEQSEWRVDEPVPGSKFVMIRVEAGEAVRKETNAKGEVTMKPSILVTDDLWLGREEVDEQLVSNFFVEQPEYRPTGWAEKPTDYYAARKLEALTIFRFCNWLSNKASLQSVYAFEPKEGYQKTNFDSVFVNLNANGYRIPFFDEFRYAGIAGDFESFKSSMESKNLCRLVSPNPNPERVTTWKVYPNAWGFQGISGNLFEIVLNRKLEFCLSTFDANTIQSLEIAVPSNDSANFQLSIGGFRLARTINEKAID